MQITGDAAKGTAWALQGTVIVPCKRKQAEYIITYEGMCNLTCPIIGTALALQQGHSDRAS